MIEITGQREEYTLQQRWGHFLTLLVAVLALLYGLNIRAGILNATEPYTNPEAGIRVSYPLNWLLDEQGDYVFRVRDMTRVGFKTTLQIATRPIGPETTESFIQNQLDISRARAREAYKRLDSRSYTLPDGSRGRRMEYVYAEADVNPFLQTLPVVVRGTDILAIRGGQVIIITFLADAQTYNDDLAIFDRFMADLEF
jgi:hypothetical protein